MEIFILFGDIYLWDPVSVAGSSPAENIIALDVIMNPDGSFTGFSLLMSLFCFLLSDAVDVGHTTLLVRLPLSGTMRLSFLWSCLWCILNIFKGPNNIDQRLSGLVAVYRYKDGSASSGVYTTQEEITGHITTDMQQSSGGCLVAIVGRLV